MKKNGAQFCSFFLLLVSVKLVFAYTCIPQGVPAAKFPEGTPPCLPLCAISSPPGAPVYGRMPPDFKPFKLSNCDVFEDGIGSCQVGMQFIGPHNCEINCCTLWADALQGKGCPGYDQYCHR